MTERVVILDAGAQYGKVIDRRVRELSVECDLLPLDTPPDQLTQYAAMIISGGPQSVYDADAPRYDPAIFSLGVPVLGICYGEMTMCAQLGGKVVPTTEREFGRAFVDVMEECSLYDEVWKPGEQYQVWMSHGDKIVDVPDGFRAVASSDSSPFAVIAHESKPFYGVQFHPEVIHTLEGAQLLRNFVYEIIGFEPEEG